MRKIITSSLAVLLVLACSQAPQMDEPVVTPSQEPSQEPSEEPTVPIGELLLDVVFDADGTATDLSSQALTMNHVYGNTLMTYLNEDSKTYIPRFYPTPGESIGTSFYRARYTPDSDFARGLADGHSLECVLMCDFEPSKYPSQVISAFSGLEKGGSGIYVRKTICFDVTVGGKAVTADSGVTPEKGVYYHVTGVYDAEAGEARIYVNGALKGTSEAKGSFTVPASKASTWYGIGVDAVSGGLATGAWRGDVADPRIYDNALTAGNVKQLYSKVAAFKKFDIEVTEGDFLSDISLRPGSAFRVFAKGLKDGDKLLFSSNDGNVILDGRLSGEMLEVSVTEELKSIDYSLMIYRGGQIAPIGSLCLVVSPDATEPRRPMTIAHRGWWLSKGVPQNSIASLKAAQDGGCEAAEMDVWITTDGGVFVNHDGVLGGVRIESSKTAQVKDLTLTNGEKIPTLDSYLDQHAKNTATTLVIEIKTHTDRSRNNACVDAVLAAVRAHGLDEHVMYIAFDLENCKRIVAARPEAMVGYLTSGSSPSDLKALGIMQLDYQLAAFEVAPHWVEEAHENGMLINMWTLDNYEDIKRAVELGADYITTNYPERVFEIQRKFFE